jgi:F0F1-type ATP synthase assembly protein I
MLPDRNPKKDGESDDRKDWAKGLALVSIIAAELLGYTGAGIGIGYWLWKKAGFPWWTILIFSSAGLVLAFYQLYQISKKDLND